MLVTDLNGLWSNLKHNKIFHMFMLLGVCILLYKIIINYKYMGIYGNNIFK